MKKLLSLLCFLIPVLAFSQNTVTPPSGTSPGIGEAWRVKGILTDSLNKRYWLIFNGGAYNEMYTATYINKYFVRKTNVDSSVFSKQFTGKGTIDTPIRIKDDALTHLNHIALLNDSGNYTHSNNFYWDNSASQFDVVAPIQFASDVYFTYQVHPSYLPAGDPADSVLTRHDGVLSKMPLKTISGTPILGSGDISISNIYIADGMIDSARTVDIADKSLTFSGTNLIGPNALSTSLIMGDDGTINIGAGNLTRGYTSNTNYSSSGILQTYVDNYAAATYDTLRMDANGVLFHYSSFGSTVGLDFGSGFSGISVTDHLNHIGLVADASVDTANMTGKVYVTAEKVAGMIAVTGGVNAGSGNKLSGDTVIWGGGIDRNTAINVSNSRYLIIGDTTNFNGISTSKGAGGDIDSYIAGSTSDPNKFSAVEATNGGSVTLYAVFGGKNNSIFIPTPDTTGHVAISPIVIRNDWGVGIASEADYSNYEVSHDSAYTTKKAVVRLIDSLASGGGVSNANNGLHLSGDTAQFGGDLTTNTVITQIPNTSINIGDAVTNNGLYMKRQTDSSMVVSLEGGDKTGAIYSEFFGNNNGVSKIDAGNGSVERTVTIDPTPSTGGMFISDSDNLGIQNAADYSANIKLHNEALITTRMLNARADSLAALISATNTIYSGDGTVSANRTVSTGVHTLSFTSDNGSGITNEADISPTDFIVSTTNSGTNFNNTMDGGADFWYTQSYDNATNNYAQIGTQFLAGKPQVQFLVQQVSKLTTLTMNPDSLGTILIQDEIGLKGLEAKGRYEANYDDSSYVTKRYVIDAIGAAGGVPTSRVLTINGTSLDLSADRSWTIPVLTAPLTGYASGAGTVSSSDNILQAFQKINGNEVLDAANIASNTSAIAGKVSTATTVAGFALSGNVNLATLTAGSSLTNTVGSNYNGSAATTLDINTAHTNNFSVPQQVTVNNAAATTSAGLELINTTAATLNNQVYTPYLHFQSNGWGTTGSASQTAEWRVYGLPTQAGNAAPGLSFDSQVAGGGWSQRVAFSGGAISAQSVTGNFGNITTGIASSNYAFYANNSTAATSGVPNQYSPGIGWRAQVWNTTATAANNWSDFKAQVITTSGTSPTSKLVFSSSLTTTSTPSFTDLLSLDNSGTLSLTGQLVVSSTIVSGSVNGNIYLPSGSGVTHVTNAQFKFGGSSASGIRTGFYGSSSTTLTANDSYAGVIIGNAPINTAASGTHAVLSNFAVKPIGTITSGGATVTETATAFFQGASSGGTNNFDIDAIGLNRMGGLQLDTLTASKLVFTDGNKRLTSTGIGTSTQGIAGDGSLFTLNSKPHTIFTPTTGGTVSLTNNQYNIINPAGALLALTVNLPSSPANNDCVFIKFTQNVTTVTYGNGTVVDGITAPTAGGLTILTYDSGTTSWY